MAYAKNVWYDNESGSTPITADKLNHIEQGVFDNAAALDSVPQKLWSGSLGAGGSITVPGLAGAKIIGLKFGSSIDTVHSVVLKDGETVFDLVQTDGGVANWRLVGFCGKITVTGSTVQCGKCNIMIADSSGLGSPFVLVNGNSHQITEVWRIA